MTNAYDRRARRRNARYAVFAGQAKAANNKVAADLRGFAFTVFYAADGSGAVTVSGGSFLVQTTNKDRSRLVVGGEILPGDTLRLRSNGWIAVVSNPAADGR